MPASPETLLDRRLLMFTGKGGVGKSTVVAALALEAARRGSRPLVVELGHRASMEPIFDVSEIGYEPTAVGHGVYAMNMDFQLALQDYITEHVKVKRLTKAILQNNALQRFFAAAPSVSEVATLNKLSALEQEVDRDGKPKWGPILVDLDATGHALMLLNLPNVMNRLVGQGPMRRLVDGFSELLRDPERTVLSLVTMPRELVAQETKELYETLSSQHDVPLGTLFVNQVPKLEVDDEALALLDAALSKGADGHESDEMAALGLLKRHSERVDRARAQIEALRESVGLPMVELPIALAGLDLDMIAHYGTLAVKPAAAPEQPARMRGAS